MNFDRRIAVLLAGFFLALAPPAAATTPRTAAVDPSEFDAKLTASDEDLYTRAFRVAERGNWRRAEHLAVQARDPLPGKILTWMRLSEGNGEAGFAELSAFIAKNPTWPRQKALSGRLERAMRRDVGDVANRRIIAWHKDRRPVTAAGHIRLAEALLAEGFAETGVAWLRHAWINDDFERKERGRILRTHGKRLRARDHGERLDRLLWDRRWRDARGLLALVSAERRRVAEARIALMRRSRDVRTRIKRVPASLRGDPGLVYERVRWRRRAGKTESARDLLAAHLGDRGPRPRKWWDERSRHVRDLIETGRMERAYAIASKHGQPAFTVGFAEAEFLSGWLALRFLDKPAPAARHFRVLYDGVRFPISRARAAYWHARASARLGNAEHARRWYRLAAQYPATYYGQLATESLGQGALLRLPRLRRPREAERRIFARRELVRAAALLSQLGRRPLFATFMRRLGRQLERPMDQYLLSMMAWRHGRQSLAIRLAKRAVRQGALVVETAYPLVGLPRTRSEPPW